MKKLIPSLNGLRALSIIFVIFGHVGLKNHLSFEMIFPFTFLADASFGVNIFFVISGFLITKLLIEEEKEFGTNSLKSFYIRRIFRIFPAYYFVLFIYFLLQLLGVLFFSQTSWFTSIFYLKYFGGGDWESGHFWSLSVEEHFYIFWPLIFKYFKVKRKVYAFGIIVMVMIFRYFAYQKTLHHEVFTSELSFFLRADALMIGCLLAIYFDEIALLFKKVAWVKYSVPLIFLLAAFFNSKFLTDLNLERKLHLGLILIPFGIGYSTGLITNILIAFLVFVSISYDTTYWFKFLNLPLMNYLGKLSYSLYLWQQLFFSEKVGVFSKLPFNLLFIVLAAVFSYNYIEKPFLRLKDRFSQIKNRVRAA